MNPKRLYILQVSVLNLAMTMMMTSAIVYRIDLAGLEPYQLILLGTALEIAVIFFEIPTGLVADKYSRKLSVVIGYFIIGIGFLVELATLKFLWIFLAQIIWGFGYTFISGALDAWVSDETHNIVIEHTYIKANTISKIMTILGIIGAFGFGIIDIRLPMLISAILYFVLSISLIFVMKENVEREKQTHSMFHQFKLGVKHIFHHPMLKIFVVTAFLLGLYSEGIDRLEEFIILDKVSTTIFSQFDSIYIVSAMHLMMAVVGFVMLLIVKRFVKEGIKTYQWFLGLTLLMSLGLLIFAHMINPYIAIAGFFFFRMTRQGLDPLYTSIQAREIPSNIKATVMSTFGQIDGIGQIFSGILMTVLAFVLGTQAILTVTALILLGVAYTVVLMIKKVKI
ncbi:MAG: MFS transporter [Acholeplasmataceae bacterium]|nr:MFS transporter [Acholeplasmataceae bacterium]